MLDPAGARSGETTSAPASALAFAREWVLPFAVGFGALLVAQAIRLPVQLPGHSGLVWIAGLLGGRLLSRNPLGGMAAGAGGMLAAMSSDPFAGLEIAVAGILLDPLVALRRLPWPLWAPLSGAVANLAILAIKLAAGSAPHAVATRGLDFATASYAIYGAIGAACAVSIAATIGATARARTR